MLRFFSWLLATGGPAKERRRRRQPKFAPGHPSYQPSDPRPGSRARDADVLYDGDRRWLLSGGRWNELDPTCPDHAHLFDPGKKDEEE